jgi:transglutaminase-like putative cysteine protease
MLLFGILLLVLSGSVRNHDIDQGNIFTAIVLLPLSAAIILLAILVPPDSYRNSGIYSSVNKFMDYLDAKFSDSSLNPTESSSTSNTLRNDVDLSQLGDRTEIDTSVMTITTNYDGRVYIRNQDFDLYTGLGWKSSENRIENDYVLTTVWRDAPEFITIKLSQTQNRYFLPCYPTQVQNLTGGIMLNSDRVTQYTLSFSQIRPDWRELWYAYNQDHTTAPEIPAADNRYLALSDDTKQRAQAIRSQLSLLSSDDPVSAADIICEYVSKSAAYSTVPSKMPQSETDFSMWFLESGNAGYCTHFASAAVVLLRAAGIPARYVEGYLVQTMQNQEVVVREDMSHAWVECYLDYVGWVIMDPTPTGSSSPSDPSAPSNSPVGTTPPDTTEPPITVPSTTTPPNTSIPGETAPPRPSTTTPTTTTAPPSETKNPEDSSLIGNQTQAPKNKNMLPTVLIWAVCCLAVLILQWVARRILIKIWLRHGSANIKAIKKYRYSQYLTRIIKVEYPAYLSELASKAAFSQYEIDDKETQAFDDYILKQTKAIRSLPLIRRFLLRFIYAVY